VVDLVTGCALEERRVTDGLVGCYENGGQVPIAFSLAQAGSGDELAWGLVLGLWWLVQRRRARSFRSRQAGAWRA